MAFAGVNYAVYLQSCLKVQVAVGVEAHTWKVQIQSKEDQSWSARHARLTLIKWTLAPDLVFLFQYFTAYIIYIKHVFLAKDYGTLPSTSKS